MLRVQHNTGRPIRSREMASGMAYPGAGAAETSGVREAEVPEVSVVIVTYKCLAPARECLESLFEATTGISFEVIVLDNASEDGTVETIGSMFPEVRLLPLDTNIGFAAGVNRAAEAATGEYLLLLNPDTIVHAGAIERLVAFARSHPEHGLYGGRTLNPDGSVNPGSCWGRPTVWSLVCFASMLSTAFKGSPLFDPESLGRWKRDSVQEVDIVTGCLLLITRGLWNELGGFDTRFFMYGEDADLGLRVASIGYRPVVTPDSVITHEVGASSSTRSDKMVLLYQSKATLVRKHWGTSRSRVGLTLLWLGVGVRALVGTAVSRRESGSVWRSVWRARGDWLAGYPDPVHPSSAPASRTP